MAWTIGPEYFHEDLSSDKYHEDYINEGEMGYIEVSFAASGTVHIYTEGGSDTVGFLTTTSNYKTDTGRPYPESYILAEDDDSGGDSQFDITCDVEEGTTYYIWYRLYREDFSGTVGIHIIPPDVEEKEYYEPDFVDTDINVSVDGTDVEITLDGLDPDYEDVWKVQWNVYAGDDWIVDGVTLRSDGYDTRWSFDRLTLNADDDGVQPNTQYTVIAYISTYPDIGSVGQLVAKNTTFTTGGTVSADRPAKFTWADGTETKKSGQEFDITADEWCDLLDNINAVRVYKGYSEFPQGSYTLTYYYNYFTYPSSGQTFRYQHYNQALNAITGMLGYGYSDHVVKQNDAITADKINYLISTLNGIT